jgi:hypothetical protein
VRFKGEAGGGGLVAYKVEVARFQNSMDTSVGDSGGSVIIKISHASEAEVRRYVNFSAEHPSLKISIESLRQSVWE